MIIEIPSEFQFQFPDKGDDEGDSVVVCEQM